MGGLIHPIFRVLNEAWAKRWPTVLPGACAGLLLADELEYLTNALTCPARPIIGGSKVATKLTVLEALSEIVDHLVVGVSNLPRTVTAERKDMFRPNFGY